MAADLRKYKSLWSSTTNSFGTGTSETITPASVTGLPTDTDITLTFDRQVAGKVERITGRISGGNFVITTRGVDGTTEQAHTSPTVEMIWNSADWNDAVASILTQHTASGTHTNITASTINGNTVATGTDAVVLATASQTLTNKTLTAPVLSGTVTGTYTLGGTPTVTDPTMTLANTTPTADGGIGFDRTNEDLAIGDGAAAQKIHMGAWKSYTPTTANITVGSGAVSGAYMQVGKTVHFWASFTMGAGSAMGTGPTFTLPVTAANGGFGEYTAQINDAGTVVFQGFVYPASTSVVQVLVLASDAAFVKYAGISATVPMTWTTNDSIYLFGTYQAA